MRWQRDEYEVDTDRARLDLKLVHGWLSGTYWASDRTYEQVVESWSNSYRVFGLYDTAHDGCLAGFARVTGDGVVFGYVADVFVVPEHRGRGLGKFVMACLLDEPDCAKTKNLFLGTRDAHGLYAQYGWAPLERPDRWLMRVAAKQPRNDAEPDQARR